MNKQRRLTYASTGVSRTAREKSRDTITINLMNESMRYHFGRAVRLPFGYVYPSDATNRDFYDLQIEGVGTKTLVAELIGKYDTIGIDGVAMAVNDVIRSGARPIMLSDAIHIGSSDRTKINALIRGVRKGARMSECILASGETGNVSEILHQDSSRTSPPFDLIVSCLGAAKRPELIQGDIKPGDSVIGLRSSGIHSNGLTLARKVLLKNWGGQFDAWDSPPTIGRPVVEELLEPTKIYVKPILETRKRVTIKAAVHITGDGFAKFHRLLSWRRKLKQSGVRIGLKFEGLRRMPPIFRLIHDTARANGDHISLAEMFRTFNMGYGFALFVDKKQTDLALDLLNRHMRAEKIGRVADDGQIAVKTLDTERPLVI